MPRSVGTTGSGVINATPGIVGPPNKVSSVPSELSRTTARPRAGAEMIPEPMVPTWTEPTRTSLSSDWIVAAEALSFVNPATVTATSLVPAWP